MSIASEIQDLSTNLTAAKNAVTAKGGTVGDTGLAGLASEIASIPAGGGGDEPGGEATITGYDTTTGVISGTGFGTTAGTVYMLDRNTHTYVAQPASSWSNTSIALTTPIDLSVIEGDTSIVAVLNDGTWSTKWLITGEIAVTGYVKTYVKNPDTGVVRTVAVDATEWGQFDATGNDYSRQITADGDTFYADEVVGVQFGTSFNVSSFSQGTLGYCTSLNQPVTIPNTVTSIDTLFLANCFSFNQPLTIPDTVTSIRVSFLNGCSIFNQPLTLPNTFTTIEANFLSNCSSFNQPLTFPNALTSIGNNFLSNCFSFNQPLAIPNTVTTIGTYFLSACYSFNQPLTIPDAVTKINANFLQNCRAFNQPLTLPDTVTIIGNTFLGTCCSFNQPLAIPNALTSIGSNFLSNCYAFNQSITIPNTVTSISGYFINNCHAFSSLTVNTTTSPTDIYSLATNNRVAKVYVKGVTVTGTGASTWITKLPNRTGSPYRKLIDGTA